jgi:predicted permease
MRSDLISALRGLRASPGFTTVALVVLTLGIGATTAIFSVVDAVALRNVPFADPNRLIAVADIDTRREGFVGGQTTPQDYLDWVAGTTGIFEGLAAVTGGGGFTLRDAGPPENLRATRVTSNLFGLLRVAPQRGRLLTPDDEVDGRHRVALISDRLWKRRFGGTDDVIGKTMKFDAGVWEIVGVMPPGFEYPIGATRAQDFWTPYVVPASQKARANSRNYSLLVVGRLTPDATIAQAQSRLTALQQDIRQRFPNWNQGRVIEVRTLREFLTGRISSWMLMLLGAVTFVLLIACVNVANLLLARATARSRDVGIRAALGATRGQLIRAFLIESLVLSGLGTVLGVIVAFWGVEILKAALPETLPRARDIGIDLRVLGAAAAAAVATGLLCGLAPAWQLSRPGLAGVLRDGGRSQTAGAARQRVRSALVVAEVALAVVLLVGSGLFLASFLRVTSVPIGLDYERVLTVPVYPPFVFSDPAQRAAGMARAETLVPQAIERISHVAGVVRVSGIANGLPLSGNWSRTNVSVPGSDRKFESDEDSVDIRNIAPGYFDVVGIPIQSGRGFTDADRTGAPVVVLNDVAAARYFAGRNPIGATITINGDRTVIGVVGSVRLGGPESEVRPEAFRPMEPKAMFGADLVIKTAGPPEALAPAVRAALLEIAPDLTLGDTRTFEMMFARLIAQRRFNMLLLTVFGALAIVITGVGIYGVMAYVVEQRTPEIGIRMALGAQPGRVQAAVLGRALTFVIVGLALGLAGAYALSGAVGAFLFQVEPGEPRVYLGTATLLVIIGLVAAWIPSRRAARVDPIIAMK